MQRSRIDLHIHSTASDGVLTPEAVVHQAIQKGLSAIALTDHDTLAGVSRAQAAAAGTGLEVIPGVEINAEGPWGHLHFLGFYTNPENSSLNERLQEMRVARIERAQRMIEKLTWMGMQLDWSEVETLAGGESVGRPHIAQALLNRGYVPTIEQAFRRYIGPNRPAYVPRLRLKSAETIEAIHRAGGVAVLAHPAHSDVDHQQIEELVSWGLQGLEVYYPDHSSEEVQFLLHLCRRHGLVATGGSDFHGPNYGAGAPIGSVFVPPDSVQQLRKAAGLG